MANLQKTTIDHFDTMYKAGITPWTTHPPEPALENFLKILKRHKAKAKVLDIGCGDGWISIKTARSGFKVWGIDGSPTAIAEAKQKAVKERLLKRVDFRVGNVLDLPFRENYFDAIVDRGLLHHILPENRQIYLENIMRVLKKEALIYLAVFNTKNPESIGQRFTKSKVKKLFGNDFEVAFFEADPYPSFASAHLLHFIIKRIN